MAASIRDIKQKVVATKKTSQITNAMNMVSASKLKGAQKTAQSFIPYMKRIEDIIINLASNAEELEHPLLNEREGNKTCYILITSDRGLAGPFNSNLCKLLTSKFDKDNDIVSTLGTKGYIYSKQKKYNMIDELVRLPDDVVFENVYPMINKVINMYLEGEVDKVVLIYNHFINTLSIQPTLKQILPIEDDFSEKEGN